MGKIDEVKEILNTLRIAMSIAFGVLVVLVGNLVNRIDNAKIDHIFWIGVGFGGVILVLITVIILKISKKTKEIKEL